MKQLLSPYEKGKVILQAPTWVKLNMCILKDQRFRFILKPFEFKHLNRKFTHGKESNDSLPFFENLQS